MIANLRDICNIIINYEGTGFLLILYAVAYIYLCITEKNKRNRLLLIYVPLIVMLMIMCPIYYRIYMGYLDDSGTYYRMMWLVPTSVTMAYAACKAISKHRRIGTIIICVLIGVCGSFIYTSTSSTKAQNAYHIPEYVVELCDHMEQDIDGVNVYACVPLEMLFYTRQYNSDICLLYGREAVEPTWGYYNEYFELYELAETLDWEQVLDKTRDTSLGTGVVSYFVVAEDRDMKQDPTSLGLIEVCRADGYVLLQDKIAQEEVREMLVGTPYLP